MCYRFNISFTIQAVGQLMSLLCSYWQCTGDLLPLCTKRTGFDKTGAEELVCTAQTLTSTPLNSFGMNWNADWTTDLKLTNDHEWTQTLTVTHQIKCKALTEGRYDSKGGTWQWSGVQISLWRNKCIMFVLKTSWRNVYTLRKVLESVISLINDAHCTWLLGENIWGCWNK